jgi:hypothetical protein
MISSYYHDVSQIKKPSIEDSVEPVNNNAENTTLLIKRMYSEVDKKDNFRE